MRLGGVREGPVGVRPSGNGAADGTTDTGSSGRGREGSTSESCPRDDLAKLKRPPARMGAPLARKTCTAPARDPHLHQKVTKLTPKSYQNKWNMCPGRIQKRAPSFYRKCTAPGREPHLDQKVTRFSSQNKWKMRPRMDPDGRKNGIPPAWEHHFRRERAPRLRETQFEPQKKQNCQK
jgi:hypothetical protein